MTAFGPFRIAQRKHLLLGFKRQSKRTAKHGEPLAFGRSAPDGQFLPYRSTYPTQICVREFSAMCTPKLPSFGRQLCDGCLRVEPDGFGYVEEFDDIDASLAACHSNYE